MVFGVPLDRLDDQDSLSALFTLPEHAVVFAWSDAVRSGEVVEAVDPAGRVVLHEEHDSAAIFHRRRYLLLGRTGCKISLAAYSPKLIKR